MKLPLDSRIAREKITNYLLRWRPENDKSRFVGQAGYKFEEWEILAEDLRKQILPLDAHFIELTPYGEMYEIRCGLTGPNGVLLNVVTIWMVEHATGQTKFITLFPDKEG